MRLRSLLPLLLALLLASAARAQLSAVRVASGLSLPSYVAAPPGDPRLFIVELGGTIRVLSGGTVLATPFLDIADQVGVVGEGGLLGLVFAPDFASSGHFFVYYTAADPSSPSGLESRVSRFTVSGNPATSNDADEASEQVFFSLDQPADNHNGGTLAIRDGRLYLALGDGGGAFGDPDDRAQDDSTRFGKMLRFDLADTTPPWTPDVWDKGFRNPFRFSFDRETHDLYIGDVGQSKKEEIDVEPAESAGGLNYGWNIEEGTNCFRPSAVEPACGDPSLVPPVFAYDHVGTNCSGAVTGGAVYRGTAMPSLDGLYFFADYCLDRIWSLRWNPATGDAEDVVERTGDIPADHGSIANVTAIAEDAAGELYFVDLNDGEVFRLVPEPGAGGLGAAALGALLALRARARRAPGGTSTSA